MIYQFDEAWNGKVVSELVDPYKTKDLYKGVTILRIINPSDTDFSKAFTFLHQTFLHRLARCTRLTRFDCSTTEIRRLRVLSARLRKI